MNIFFVRPLFDGACGVADYQSKLKYYITQSGFNVVDPAMPFRARHGYSASLSIINNYEPDIIHIQYPMAGFGFSLWPHYLCMRSRVPVVITLHEFTQAHLLRRLSTFAFFNCKRMIFTNPFECHRYNSQFPFHKAKRCVIPIGSNIPSCGNFISRSSNIIAFFGLMRKNRGLAQFLDLANLSLRAGRPYKFRIIGSVPIGSESFYKTCRQDSAQNGNIEWLVGLSEIEVSARLAESTFAYMPYPDGASDRRGSLLAALGNGVVVITNVGSQTPENLVRSIIHVDNPSDALIAIDRVYKSDSKLLELREFGYSWMAERSWPAITARHMDLYNSIL